MPGRGPNDGRFFGRNGALNDYIPRIGDPVPPNGIAPRAQRFAGVALVPNFNSNGAQRKTLIDTGDLGSVKSLAVRLLFAFDLNNSRVQPQLPWLPQYTGDGAIKVTIRRGLDTLSNVVEESTLILGAADLAPFGDGDQFGLDIIEARNLSISVEFTHGLSDVWVQATATEVTEIGTQERVPGWTRFEQRTIPAANVATQLAKARPGRTQFIIANTSTDADLYIGFSPAVNVLGPASIILPRNIFAQYESPVGGWAGEIWGMWTPAPTGNAFVTEGFYR